MTSGPQFPRVIFTDRDGQTLSVEAKVGDSVMETAIRNRVPGILAECGGFMACATCHVYVAEADLDRLPPASDAENEMLWGVAAPRQNNSRLSCQLRISGGSDLHVTLPITQR